MELKEDEESAAAPAAEPSFLERFFGVRFDELVAAAQPQPAMQQLAEDLEDRLESLADLAESSASEGEEVTEQQPPLHAPPPPPPWRDCRLSATDRQNFSSGCAACSVAGKGGMGNSPPSSSTSACASAPTMAAMSRSNVSEREQQAAASSSAATAATAASSAGAEAGSYVTGADGERYFANGHLTSSMIGLSVGICHSFEFVFPSIKFKLFVDFYFTEAFMPVPARISGDPFRAPKWYTDAGGSQREWEREHGHQRERGGSILGTLIHDFYCSGSSSVLQVLAVELQSHSMALQFDCFYET